MQTADVLLLTLLDEGSALVTYEGQVVDLGSDFRWLDNLKVWMRYGAKPWAF